MASRDSANGGRASRHRGPARDEGEMNDTDARRWHPWLRINRVLRVMLHTRWSAEAKVAPVTNRDGARRAQEGQLVPLSGSRWRCRIVADDIQRVVRTQVPAAVAGQRTGRRERA